MTSSRMSAGRCLATASRAWSPRSQEPTSKPSPFSTSSSPSRMCESSSTMRILVFIERERGFCLLNRFQRQAQGETASGAGARFVNDIAAVGAGDLAGEGQAEAGALDTATQGIMRAIKFFEDFLFTAARHTYAAIEDFHFSAGQGTIAAPDFDFYPFVVARIF